MNSTRIKTPGSVGLVWSLLLSGCSSTSVTQVGNSTGAAPSTLTTGGAKATGIATSTLATGGSRNPVTALGGVAAIGGTAGLGGVQASLGGSSPTTNLANVGGVSAAGGTPTTGGTVSTGGASVARGSGGATLAGGASNTGGASAASLGGTVSTATIAGGTSGAGGKTASSGGITNTGGAGTGGESACTGGTMKTCSGSCVDISSAPAHCGSCGHDCGGGTCTLGVCQAMTVYTAALPVTALAVSTSEVIFSTYDDTNAASKLLACPAAGCSLTPRQLVALQYSINSVAWLPDGASAGMVVFQSAPTQSTERPALFPCPDTGCVGTPVSAVSDGLGGFDRKLQVVGNKVFYNSQNLQLNALTCGAGTCTNGTSLGVGRLRPFASNGTLEYFIDSGPAVAGHTGYILSCDLSLTPPCAASTVLATDVASATDMQIVGSTLYWLMPGRASYSEGRIRRCALPACSTPTDLVSSLNSPTEMLVDGDGAYIVNAANKIQRCNGTDCVGGAQDWVAGTAPHQLHSDSMFVYWADGALVHRVAK